MQATSLVIITRLYERNVSLSQYSSQRVQDEWSSFQYIQEQYEETQIELIHQYIP